MLRFGPAVALAMALAISPAFAAKKKTEKEKCLQEVADVVAVQKEADVVQKIQNQVDNMVEIATHLCEQGNFKYASEVMAISRGMLATE